MLTGAAGADSLAMLRDALKMGASAVGGCPDLDPDPSGYAESVLRSPRVRAAGRPATAADDPARLARLAAMAGGLRPGVTLGPCHGLAALGPDAMAVPPSGWPPRHLRRGAPPGRLRRAGPRRRHPGSARCAAAAYGSPPAAARSPTLANPVGRGDPLEAAFLLASHGECPPIRSYDLISGQARAVLGLPAVRVEAGFPAELLAVRGESLAGVLSLAYSRIVIHRGRVVSRTSAVRESCDSAGDSALDLPRQAHREE